LHFFQPFIGHVETVFLFDVGAGNVIKRPHTFIKRGDWNGLESKKCGDQRTQEHS
jgi:hypothetical protein